MTLPPPLRGFVLQPTYRVEAGRPVVHLYGRLEDERTFLVRDGRETPHFYVEATDAARAREQGARRQVSTDRVALGGAPVVRVEVPTPADTPPLRERLARAGIRTHEADVRFAMRYLIDRGIRGSLAIRGEARPDSEGGVVFEEPDVTPADWSPRLRVLSFDIETDPKAQRLLAIALHGCGASEVLLLTPDGMSCPPDASPFARERDLLAGFCARVRAIDPDVITGWNVLEFDLPVLQRLAGRAGVPLELGRGKGTMRLRASGSPRGLREATIPGRVVLDGIPLVRGSFVRMEDWSLDAVARTVLGEGKLLAGHGRADEILRLFNEDRSRLVEYNRTDARLALEILERLHLVELAVERSRLTGLPIDRVSSSIAAFDFLYLSELGRRGIVAPSVGTAAVEEAPQSGGHVLEPMPGLHTNVAVLDFKSLYPSVIRTFEIDPLNLLRPQSSLARDETDPIVSPSGAAFARQRGILPSILDELMPRREEAKRQGDAVTSQAIKILMNSFYGVLGTPACRFYDPRLANAITSFGRHVLVWCQERIEARGHRVLYGDTDSLFVETGAEEPQRARLLAETLAAELNRELAAHVAEGWRVTSRLELMFDRLYRRLLLPALRHGTAGARKRYAGLVDSPRGGQVVFTGMEAVRGDWTDLARDVQRELYARLFAEQEVAEYLRVILAEVREGRHDERLVYRKSLRKPPEAYTATTPPHVAAARQIAGKRRGRVAYVITTAGPEPAETRTSPLDHEHYVEKQIRPVAEPVLALLGLDFDDLSGRKRQLSLF